MVLVFFLHSERPAFVSEKLFNITKDCKPLYGLPSSHSQSTTNAYMFIILSILTASNKNINIVTKFIITILVLAFLFAV